MTHEELPLSTVFREVFLYLAKRDDAVLFGAQAVNAYCEPTRFTEDVDVFSTNAKGLAEDLRAHLNARFHAAIRVREVAEGMGFRVYQSRKPKPRHLVDVRHIDRLPESRIVEGVRVVAPVQLVAQKTLSTVERRGREKGLSDRLDLVRLLRTFPDLRTDEGAVAACLRAMHVNDVVLDAWREAVATRLEVDGVDLDDDSDFKF